MVQQALGQDEQTIYNNLTAKDLKPEMSDEDYIALMVWHRELTVPATNNLDDEKVKQEEDLLHHRLLNCHRRFLWNTGDDDYTE